MPFVIICFWNRLDICSGKSPWHESLLHAVFSSPYRALPCIINPKAKFLGSHSQRQPHDLSSLRVAKRAPVDLLQYVKTLELCTVKKRASRCGIFSVDKNFRNCCLNCVCKAGKTLAANILLTSWHFEEAAINL